MALKKSQLYRSLWQSCDELRGGMDASQYKDYVLTLLFMKYVSDKYAGTPNAVIEIPAGGGFADMIHLKGDKEFGDKINKIIAKLAVANDLKGVIDVAACNDEHKLDRGQEMEDYLAKIVALTRQVANADGTSTYPPAIDSAPRRALYDNLDRDEALTLRLDAAVLDNRRADWRGHKLRERLVRKAIAIALDHDPRVPAIFDLVKAQRAY